MKVCKTMVAVLLSLCLLLASLAGCGAKGKTLLELEGSELSVNLFTLFLSRMKGNLCSSYSFGESALSPSFWDIQMNENGQTYNDYYTDKVLSDSKTYLAALYLFEEQGLKLPDSYVQEIDAELQEMLELHAGGSKTQFNSLLGEYGVNYDLLREAYLLEAKIEYLKLTRYGENGSLVSSELVEQYYQNNYVRFKQVFLSTQRGVYETDANGDDVYYREDGSVAYQKEGEGISAKKDADGNFVRDKKGDVIYCHEDGSVAYDTINGKRQPIYGDDGSTPITVTLTGSELQAVIDKALIVQNEAENAPASAREVVFDNLSKYILDGGYNEDSGSQSYTGGYYVTPNESYNLSSKVLDKVYTLEVGEVGMVQSDEGIYVLMRYEMDAGAYAKEENKIFFVNQNTGVYYLISPLVNSLFSAYLAPYAEKVTVDEEVLATVDIKRVSPNFSY
ncbi:MAG: hypothetical protein IJY42_01725 [Clostridia bacterium]|nr:hypothetical protein [Clostridia bacterium]